MTIIVGDAYKGDSSVAFLQRWCVFKTDHDLGVLSRMQVEGDSVCSRSAHSLVHFFFLPRLQGWCIIPLAIEYACLGVGPKENYHVSSKHGTKLGGLLRRSLPVNPRARLW